MPSLSLPLRTLRPGEFWTSRLDLGNPNGSIAIPGQRNFGLRVLKAEELSACLHPIAKQEDVPGYIKLKYFLDVRIIEKHQRELGFISPSSPPIRSLFVKEGGALYLRGQMNNKDDLMWLMGGLMNKEAHCPKGIIATDLNRFVQTADKKQRERISPMVARTLGGLGLVYELRSQLRLLAPQLSRKQIPLSSKQHGEIEAWAIEELRPRYDLKMIVSPSHARAKFLRLGEIGDPARLSYPVNSRRTKDNVDMMQGAERRLDVWWEKYDAQSPKTSVHRNQQFASTSNP